LPLYLYILPGHNLLLRRMELRQKHGQPFFSLRYPRRASAPANRASLRVPRKSARIFSSAAPLTAPPGPPLRCRRKALDLPQQSVFSNPVPASPPSCPTARVRLAAKAPLPPPRASTPALVSVAANPPPLFLRPFVGAPGANTQQVRPRILFTLPFPAVVRNRTPKP
jgi:hypothetical protein